MRVYTYLDLTSFTNDKEWTTLFNSRAPDANVNSIRSSDDINRCCPWVMKLYISRQSHHINFLEKYIRTNHKCIHCLQFDYEYIDPIKLNAEIQKNGATNSIQRISCTMTQKEFVEKYVRTSTPVLIQGCNFNWLDDVDLDLSNAAKVNQENHNIAVKLIA